MAQFVGHVKWFNSAKGYGFVGHDGGPDVFCHFSSIQADGYRTLKEGDEVEFDIIQGEKGPQTHDVRKRPAAPDRLAPDDAATNGSSLTTSSAS